MPTCAFCWTAGAQQRCGKCRSVFYCDTECQRRAWRQGHKNECQPAASQKAQSDAGTSAHQQPAPGEAATSKPSPAATQAERSLAAAQAEGEAGEPHASGAEERSGLGADADLAHDSCSICLDGLLLPCTLPCGHNFCLPCARSALRSVSRCPTCRRPVPAAPMPVPNILLGELLRAKDLEDYDTRLAALPDPLAGTAPAGNPEGEWVLFVDHLTPSCVAVLAVARKLTIPDRALRVVEQRTIFCDHHCRTEWHKPNKELCVPRLECGGGGGRVVLTAPQAIVRTLLDLLGEGLLEPGAHLSYARRAEFVEVLGDVWPRLVAPISLHVFRAMWDDSTYKLGEVVEALTWADTALVPLVLEARDEGRPTVLDCIAGAALALLLNMGSHILQDGLQHLPALRAWLQNILSDHAIAEAPCRFKTKANTKQHEAYFSGRLGAVERHVLSLQAKFNDPAWSRGSKLPMAWPYERAGTGSGSDRWSMELDYETYRSDNRGGPPDSDW